MYKMNYQIIYNQLVNRAQNRVLEGYKEKHHIIPRCMGGTDGKENLVELTAREHFLCHMLLCEIYPQNIKLYHALWMMSNIKKRKEFQNHTFISSKQYENIKLIRNKLFKKQWYDIRLEKGLIINDDYINKFIVLYPNIKLSENNKHCINYSFNNNINLKNIVCYCGCGVKRFKNYIKGYQNYCSRKCCNNFTKDISNMTKENKGIWDNSKKRLRQQEVELLGKENIEILRRKRISNGNKGKTAGGHSRGKHIIQYDLKGNYIKEWPSIRQAGIEIKNTSGETIRKCLIGLQETAYGYKWKYK